MHRTGSPTAPESVPEFAALVAELREEFFREARQECRALTAAFERRLREPDRAQARQVIHRWAGLGGTLGYPDVTRLAREIEQLLRAPEWALLSARLAELARVFDNPPPAKEI